jgi:hypothetical protein
METLLESLVRYFEIEGRGIVVTDSTAVGGIEKRLLDLTAQDASTFPYLP